MAMGRSGAVIIGCLGWEFWWQGVLSALAQRLAQQTPQRDRLRGIFTVAIAHSSTHLPKPWVPQSPTSFWLLIVNRLADGVRLRGLVNPR